MTLAATNGTNFWHTLILTTGRDEPFEAFAHPAESTSPIDLESAALMGHMSGRKPESSGLRELRVLGPCCIATAFGSPPFS